ncbi:multidrug resistance-associated ABC transporter [Trametes maxima]|nr:multidrug resistance-associated ABC transporter [Trametes maxima]
MTRRLCTPISCTLTLLQGGHLSSAVPQADTNMAIDHGAALALTPSSLYTREFWAAILPFVFVLLILLSLTSPIRSVLRAAGCLLPRVLTLPEAEALLAGEDASTEAEVDPAPEIPLWRTLVLSAVSLSECLLWAACGCYTLIVHSPEAAAGVLDLLIAVTWLYAALRPIVRPTATAAYDLLVLFGLHLALSIIVAAGWIYDQYVYGTALPQLPVVVLYLAHLLAVLSLFVVVMSMPLDLPSSRVKKEDIGVTVSPEDYTTVWGWATFRWVLPLLDRGMYRTLNEGDVWLLSPLMRCRPLHIKFSRSQGTLLKRIWDTNRFDMVLDATLTYVSIGLNYAGPFFLKRILDALTVGERDREKRALAFVYAFLSFLCIVAKAEVDIQHLYVGRRAAARVRSALMASIYDKALKRKDFSGVVGTDEATMSADGNSEAAGEANEPKTSAGIGKIVNLMAVDANRISVAVSTLFYIYGGPCEILMATIFLYQLLGVSAFAGLLVLMLTWPLSSIAGKNSLDIQKGASSARDKRMGILSELIGAIKFIKFFAWEDRWIQRVLAAREVELQWLVKARINTVFLTLIFTCLPTFVSVASFFVYVTVGNELTIGTAFTAIALYQMLRGPFNFLPNWVVQLFQAKVAIERVSAYLDEEEVDEQVSTIKKGHTSPSNETSATGLGILNGSFKWNEVQQGDEVQGGGVPNSAAIPTSINPSDSSSTAANSTSDTAVGSSDRSFMLKDINVLFPEGRLTLVTGPTASGKTALLMALLGELTTLDGQIIMAKNPSKVDEHGLTDTLSYAAQSPWLRHESIKENILFGLPYDEARYEAVVECCALRPDLEILEDGDETEIGARGVSLSGGQKARVALARAVYAPSKYVLLDDPLSAVDSHTARILYEKLIKGPLLAHRTIVLVTHHVELVLPGAYYLVRMLDGRIDVQGLVGDLEKSGVLGDIALSKDVEESKNLKQATASADENPEVKVKDDANDISGTRPRKLRKLVEDEQRAVGSVKWHVYNTYLKASSYWTWGILSVFIVLVQVLAVSEKIWIKIWGEAYERGDESLLSYPPSPDAYVVQQPLAVFEHASPSFLFTRNITLPLNTTALTLPAAQQHPYFYIGIYAAITLATGLVNIAGVVTQYTGALRASRILFDTLIRNVVHATMRWHDTTPHGRILNRFGKDIETLDTSLAGSLQSVNRSLAILLVSMLTVVAVFPRFIFPAVILGYLYRRASIAYLNTARDVQRMESNARSPIFANFGEMLEGIVTVRAFGAEQRFLEDLYTRVDLMLRMWYTFWQMNRWLLFEQDVLGAMGILITTLFALSGYVDAGLAGVSITSAMSFTGAIYWTCRFWTALELDLNSVERVVEYLQLPQEPPTIIESSRPPAYWPSSTSTNKEQLLVVEDLTVKYAPELPAVLHGVSFALKAKERVGLLGRTGSGKSTLAMSILRFTDPAQGRIIIDGVDISKIGVHDLRSRITFIPQDATLFSGTLRDNLDPFGEHTDAECLDVLFRVQLLSREPITAQSLSLEASRASSLREADNSAADSSLTLASNAAAEDRVSLTLDSQVSPGGANFSQGQRQLIAMARALLRRSAIIILDEATSSIDFATDAKIQTTIREEFGDSLLLTVAHRLRTVIDYDRLLVLDQGKLVEFDTPLNLINKEGGIFRTMCIKSGIYSELEAAAREKL